MGEGHLPVLVDEVQYAPGLFRHIKRFIDEQRSERGLYLLTGSQKFTLIRSVSESLAGRAAIGTPGSDPDSDPGVPPYFRQGGGSPAFRFSSGLCR